MPSVLDRILERKPKEEESVLKEERMPQVPVDQIKQPEVIKQETPVETPLRSKRRKGISRPSPLSRSSKRPGSIASAKVRFKQSIPGPLGGLGCMLKRSRTALRNPALHLRTP